MTSSAKLRAARIVLAEEREVRESIAKAQAEQAETDDWYARRIPEIMQIGN